MKIVENESTPGRFVCWLMILIVLSEAAIMTLLNYFSLSFTSYVLLNCFLLTALLLPLFYYLLCKTIPEQNGLSDPNVNGIILNSRDITEHKRREQDFKKFFHAVEQSPSSVVITDEKGRIEYANPKYTELTGYSLNEIKGKNPRILKSGQVPMETYEQLWKTITSGEDWRGELLNKKKNGELFWETASISSIKNEDGKITNFIGVKEDVTKRKEAEEKVHYMVYHDNLTGLPNRVLFNDRLEVALAQARRSKLMVAVIFMDLDGFKTINDTLGHGAGDLLLKDIAQRLKTCLRAGDTASRFGGDEFTFMFSGMENIQSICKVAEKILSVVRQPWYFHGREQRITPSMGISLYPNDADDAEGLINKADIAMYLVKECGKNSYRFFSSPNENGHKETTGSLNLKH